MSYKNGLIPWNKGLTKETDSRIANLAEHLKTANWCKGLKRYMSSSS